VISGNGDVSTFLAQLDQLAKASGVQLDLYEPTAAAAPATAGTPPPPGAPPKPASPSADPLEAEGLQSHAIVLAARGNFPQLLVFLRQMEALNVLVVQSDLQLNLEAQPGVAAPATANEPVRLKMALKLYSKNTAQTPVKPAASGGAATVEPPN
jgi:type IV pilus assembly protein PilO